jgi:hypothetical protein
MAAERKYIDVDKIPELSRIVDEIEKSRSETVLLRNGKASALVTPLDFPEARDRELAIDPERQLEALHAAAGGWRGLVDGDKLIEDIYAARELPSRALPKL